MKQLIYTLTLSAAMLGASSLVMGKSPSDNRGDDQRCEAQCEVKKEACESLPTKDAVQKCRAKVEQDCKQVCKEADNDDPGRDKDRNHR